MKRVVCLLLSLILLLGLLPTALAADGEGTGEKLEYGEPVGFTVEIEGEKRICFMGVGQLINGKYNLLSETTMGWASDQFGALHVAVGLWWLKDFGGGNYDWIALTSDEVDAVTKQVGPFSLEISPDSGQGTTPDAQNETDASAPKMPCQCFYKLQKEHRGKWILEASCTVKGTTLKSRGAATLAVMEDVRLDTNQCKTVEGINAALKAKIKELQEKNAKAEADSYKIIVYLTETDQDAYRGQIRIEDWRVDGVELWVQIQGIGQGPNGGVQNIPVTLTGGIYSDTIPFSAAGINFKGAGKEYETWPEDGPNAGKLNVAFDGNSESNLSNCTFTGYDIAIKCGTSLRMFGRYNTFTKNHIAWKLSEACKGDGNPDAQSCVFKENDYALYVEKFNGFPSNYAPRYCRFIDNGYDVYNGSGRWWFLPGNFFRHGESRKPVYDRTSAGATSVFCYPMATREGTNGQEENNPVTYYYDQLEDGGDTVSNALTSTYQTPAGKLDGKTFKVADAEKDNILATFSFDDTVAEQAEEEPVQPVLRARMLRSAVEPSFDATVSVDRSDASKIEFTMQDPCKQVNVSLPCSFTDGTVKLGQTEILDAKFDGQTVSFQTKKAGTYVIESKTPVQPKPDDAITGIISGIVASGALQPGASASQFADLTAGSWYYGGVRYALENGLMTGTSARTFAPDRPVTRAMLVTILWRLAGEPYGRVSPFEDVLPGSWYAQAVSWAYDKGIVTGVTATSFQPGAPVTREQLCAILCRYAALTGKNTAASASLDAFTDRAQVSAYAEASVRWALQAGLLTGVGDGRLAPRSGATRAQLAVLLQRFAGLK